MNSDIPFHVDGRGRAVSTGEAGHIQDLIEQTLLTAPGERVMGLESGTGLLCPVFELATNRLM